MTQPVDFTDLRTMTDGDKDMELMLFDEFYSSTEAGINTMAANCTDGANAAWRATAHALKGSAYNLGAHALGDLCKQAQEHPDATGSDKQALLQKITSEYAAVKAYLQTVHAS